MELSQRPRIPLAWWCVAALVAFAWHAGQTVRPPGCEVTVVAFADASGEPLPVDGMDVTWEDLDEQAYQDMVASGRCAPPAPRWRHWLG
ncbi:hypothetical protein AB0H29_04825 [Streptomyces thermolilacinus]